MSSLAPNSCRIGFPKNSMSPVNTTDKIINIHVQHPITFSACSLSPLPIKIDAFGAPPILTSAAKAEIARITGAVTPTPAKACFPTPGICPINILSTRLYKILISCAATAGSASLRKAFGTGITASNSLSSFIFHPYFCVFKHSFSLSVIITFLALHHFVCNIFFVKNIRPLADTLQNRDDRIALLCQ